MDFPIWLRKCGDWVFVGTGTGSWTLTDLERTLIDNVAELLSSETRDLLHRQLQEEYLVDR